MRVRVYTLLLAVLYRICAENHNVHVFIHRLGIFTEFLKRTWIVEHGHNSYVSSHLQALYVVYDKRVKTITNSNTINVQFRKVLGACTEFWCLQWIWSISLSVGCCLLAGAFCILWLSIEFMQMFSFHFALSLSLSRNSHGKHICRMFAFIHITLWS